MVTCKQHVTHEGLNKKSNTIYRYPEDCVLEQRILIAEGYEFYDIQINLDTVGAFFDEDNGYLGGHIGVAVGDDIDSWAYPPTTLASFFNRKGRNDIDVGSSALHWEEIQNGLENVLTSQHRIPWGRYLYPDYYSANVHLKQIVDALDKDIVRVYVYYTQHKYSGTMAAAPALFVYFNISRVDNNLPGGWNWYSTLDNNFGFTSFGDTVDISNMPSGYKYEDMMTTSISGMPLTDFDESPSTMQNKIACLGVLEYNVSEQKIWWIPNNNIFSLMNELPPE